MISFASIRRLSAPPVISFLAATIAALGAWFSAIDQDRTQKNFEDAQKELGKKAEEINRKSQEIADLNAKLLESVTGGGGFAWLSVYPSKNGSVSFDVISRSDHSVYDLVAIASTLSEIPNKPGVFYGGAPKRWAIGNVPPNFVVPGENGAFKLQPNKRNKIEILFAARNGHWRQDIFFVPDGSGFQYATRVFRSNNKTKEVVYEMVPDGFPQPLDW